MRYERSTPEQMEEALREVTRLSGADLSDGFPSWPPLHEFAVQEVRQLRADYDEACQSEWNEDRYRRTLERVKVELRGTTAQGGDAEALIDQALTAAQGDEGL